MEFSFESIVLEDKNSNSMDLSGLGVTVNLQYKYIKSLTHFQGLLAQLVRAPC